MSSPVCGENVSCKLRYSVKKIRGFYEKMGAFLVDLFQADQPGKGKQELQEELTALRTGSNETVRSYYIRKFSTVLMVLTIGVVLSIVCFFAYAGKTSDVEDQTLMRPGYGEGNRQEELAVEVDGKEVRQLEITIQERKYTEKEKRELTERAIKELEQILPGQNKSLDEVREDLVFPETLMDGAVTASYVTTPYGIVDESGVLLDVEKEDGVLVEIQVTLTCGENEMRHVVHAKVFPRILTQDEQLQKEIRRAVEQRDAKESHEETLELPGNVDGRRLVWQYQEENPFATVFALALIAAVLVYLEMDSRVHARAEDRKNQLMLDYPDLMWKMTMLLGAGLTIKGTFQRMAKQYYRDRRKLRYVYEEVLYTCREMESGVSEAEAYERFGRRCGLPEYIQLGSVLSQNLKKGARGLTALLEEEALSSMTERKNNARKLGEKAGTKLLFPMILMLGIVMVILMVPAFLAF